MPLKITRIMHESPACEGRGMISGLKSSCLLKLISLKDPPLVHLEARGNEKYNKYHMNYSVYHWIY